MTWADQEKRRKSFLNAVDRASEFTQAFYTGFLSQDTYLGLLTYEDALKLSQTCSLMHKTFEAKKAMKKLVRYGNLDVSIRPKYWKKISD